MERIRLNGWIILCWVGYHVLLLGYHLNGLAIILAGRDIIINGWFIILNAVDNLLLSEYKVHLYWAGCHVILGELSS